MRRRPDQPDQPGQRRSVPAFVHASPTQAGQIAPNLPPTCASSEPRTHLGPVRLARTILRFAVGLYATESASLAERRSTRLFQYGGPRAGSRAGGSVGSPRWRSTRLMEPGSVTIATSFMRAPQRGQ